MSDKYCVREEIHLPNEILAIIINNLASDAEDNDRTLLLALASCRLASHALCSIATPLLFSSIQFIENLDDDPHPYNDCCDQVERATKLKQILTTSDIAPTVHTLALHCQQKNLENSIYGTLISAIIHHLPHIRTFILTSEGGSLEFTAITGDFALAIKALCRSPNLTTLDLGKIEEFPFTVIAACPNLQCLRLTGVGFCFDDTNPIDETLSLQPCNLDSLDIDYYSIDSLGIGIFVLPGDEPFATYFSRIKNLRLKDLFSDGVTLKCGWDIMLLASQSLTTLDLPRDEFVYYSKALPDVLEVIPFDLGRFPALRLFKIQMQTSPRDDVTMLSFLIQLFSISSSTSGVETLEIIITWVGVDSGCEKDLFSSDVGWSTLDEFLSSEKFVSLQKIVLGLRLQIRPEVAGRATPSHNPINPELERSLTLPYVNALFPTFRALTNPQRTLDIHVEIIP